MRKNKQFNHLGEDILCMDFTLPVLALLCSGFGLALIYSATSSLEIGSERYMMVQSLAIGLGLLGFVLLSFLDLERFAPYWRIVLLLNVLLQLSLIFFGYEDGGNKSWLRFLGIGIQPAEIGKLLFIFTFARQIALCGDQLSRPKNVGLLLLHVALMVAVILVPSSDVGMTTPYMVMALVMLFAAGLRLRWFIGAILLGAAAAPLVWQMLSSVQRNRILVLFDPSISPDSYWQQEQSRIAIGAGRITGMGFLKGSQTQNNMLPEKQTDFIFSVAGEEWGMVGCAAILLLLSLLILRVFWVACHAESRFLMLLCVGTGSMYLFQMIENVFMCLGIGPVMGLTLPFFSYGGTSVVTMYLSLGVVESVSWQYRRRKRDGILASETVYIDEVVFQEVLDDAARDREEPPAPKEQEDETADGERPV